MALRLLSNTKDQPESVAEIDAKINAQLAEAARLRAEKVTLQDTLILADVTDPKSVARILEIDVLLPVIAQRQQRYQAERVQAQSREALVGYERRCIAEAQVVQRKRDIDAQIAQRRAQLQKLAEASAEHLAQIENISHQRIHFGAEYPEAVRASLTTLARKEIEYQHGLANDEEIAGARRQATTN